MNYLNPVEREAVRNPMTHQIDPLAMRILHLNNIFVSPMCQYSGTDGCVNGWHLVHVCSAAVGAGCVLTEAKATEVLPTAGSVGLIWVSIVKRACRHFTPGLFEC